MFPKFPYCLLWDFACRKHAMQHWGPVCLLPPRLQAPADCLRCLGLPSMGTCSVGCFFPDNWKRWLVGQAVIWVFPDSLFSTPVEGMCVSELGAEAMELPWQGRGFVLMSMSSASLTLALLGQSLRHPQTLISKAPLTPHWWGFFLEDQVTRFHEPLGDHHQPIRNLTVSHTHLSEPLNISDSQAGSQTYGQESGHWG